MPGIFANLTTWIDQRQKECWPESITYQRGADSVEITATIGATDFERDDGDGVQIAWKSADFLILASELVLSGVATQPRRGDRIVKSHAGGTRTYEVLAINGEAHFAWSGTDSTVMRVHTKLIRDE